MSDRVQALTVALDHDVHEEDVKAIVSAILMIRGVQAVTTEVVDADAYVARERALAALRKTLWDILYPPLKKG